jgi:transposase
MQIDMDTDVNLSSLKWLMKWRNTKQSKHFSAQSITVDCDSLTAKVIKIIQSRTLKIIDRTLSYSDALAVFDDFDLPYILSWKT